MFWSKRKKHPRIEHPRIAVSAKADLSCSRTGSNQVWLLFTSLENGHELELVLSEFTARDLREVLSEFNLEAAK